MGGRELESERQVPERTELMNDSRYRSSSQKTANENKLNCAIQRAL